MTFVIELGAKFIEAIAHLADTIAKSTDAAIQAEVDKVTRELKASSDKVQAAITDDKGE